MHAARVIRRGRGSRSMIEWSSSVENEKFCTRDRTSTPRPSAGGPHWPHAPVPYIDTSRGAVASVFCEGLGLERIENAVRQKKTTHTH